MRLLRAVVQEVLWPCRTVGRVRRMVAAMTFEPDAGEWLAPERSPRAVSPAEGATHRGEVDEQRAV